MLGGGLNTLTRLAEDKAVECPQGPTDTPSDIAWIWTPQTQPFLFASAWDGTVRAWEVQTQTPLDNRRIEEIPARVDPIPKIVNIVPKALWNNNVPTLTLSPGPGVMYSGTVDKRVLVHDLNTQQTQQIGTHDNPVCKVFHNPANGLLISLSWDRVVKVWDVRTPKVAGELTTPTPMYSGDLNSQVLAVLCDDKNVYAYDLQNYTGNPTVSVPFDPLTYSARSVRLFPDNQGVVIAGYEGRCRIANFDQQIRGSMDFTFRCHRLQASTNLPVQGPTSASAVTLIHSVNCIDFNPIYRTLITSGADGAATTWDKDARQRICMFGHLGGPVSCGKFDMSGRLFGYGTGYDWSGGINGKDTLFRKNQAIVNRVCVLMLHDEAIHTKPKKQQ